MNTTITQILNSPFFRSILGKASKMSGSRGKLVTLAFHALNYLKDAGGIGNLGKAVVEQFTLFSQMVYHFAAGNYKEISHKSIVIIIGTLIYFVSPLDLVPDFLPGLGYLDDITLLSWSFSLLATEIKKFTLWKKKYDVAENIDFEELKLGK